MHAPTTYDTLLALGMVSPFFGGIQIDLNTVTRTMPDGSIQSVSLCDHNCTAEVGGYSCPAAFTVNRGMRPRFTPAEKLFGYIEKGWKGLSLYRAISFQQLFDDYCQAFAIPLDVRTILEASLNKDLCEVNLFGGNPEMHPDVIRLIRHLKRRGFQVNLTTTGRRLLKKPDFLVQFLANPPDVLALSADDFDPARLDEFFEMPLQELATSWKKIDPLHGQAQKFVEGVYAARLLREYDLPTKVLFNMVIHRGNIQNVRQMIAAIARHLPKALVNPYPAQDSFEGGDGQLFSVDDLDTLAGLVSYFIHETKNENPNLTRRLSYWLVMAAALEQRHNDPAATSALVAGHGIWMCYRPGAGRYLQIGRGRSDLIQFGIQRREQPGGYLGCYWNNGTVTQGYPISSEQLVAHHLTSGMQSFAKISPNPCPGCSMPRLWFDMISTEMGLAPDLREPYLRLRKKHVGF